MSPAGGVDTVLDREFVWTDTDFHRIRDLIYQRAGISLHDNKHAMVYSRLSRRLRATGHTSFRDYLGWLQAGDGPEWQEFVNALTTNLTSFFREHHHFEILTEHLQSLPKVSKLRIWCNAASTGEEPYSIAMTLLETLGSKVGFELVASDIDSKVLASAARGVYRLEGLNAMGDERLQRFFMRGIGGNEGMVRVRSELRKAVDFVVINLMSDDWPLNPGIDVVFCRNVMIYFDAATQRKVLQKIHRTMKPGGLLFAGHSENFSNSRDLFFSRGKTVYERV
jgi:chemotaxis protein methyltransferase CheR